MSLFDAPLSDLDSVNDPIAPSSEQDPRDAASFWLAREKSGRMDEAERRQLQAWLDANPAHLLEYKRAQGIWNAISLVPGNRLRQLAQEPATPAPRFLQRRGLLIGGAAACTAAISGGIALSWFHQGETLYEQQFATRQGEREQVSLPDGSIIELNTATTLHVQLFEQSRVVTLASGEASFTVASDTQRPFLVDAGDTSVRVTGTRFGVRRDEAQVRVVVESGSVQVQHGPWWSRSTAALTAKQGVSAQAGTDLVPMGDGDVASLMAWTQGRLLFSDTPLIEAINEINRYAPKAVQANRQELQGLHIAGAFSTGDTAGFLELLPDIVPVTVSYLRDGTPVVSRRP